MMGTLEFIRARHNSEMEQVVSVVADVYKVGKIDLVAHRRDAFEARHVAWSICRFVVGASLPQIGRFFGRDHSSILYGVKSFQQRIIADPAHRAKLVAITRRLGCPEFLSIGE